MLDGDTLYVDRNGNGDLTEPGEKLQGKTQGEGERQYMEFEVGDLRDGPHTHRQLTVTVRDPRRMAKEDLDARPELQELIRRAPQARLYTVRLDVAMPDFRGSESGGLRGRSSRRVLLASAAGQGDGGGDGESHDRGDLASGSQVGHLVAPAEGGAGGRTGRAQRGNDIGRDHLGQRLTGRGPADDQHGVRSSTAPRLGARARITQQARKAKPPILGWRLTVCA